LGVTGSPSLTVVWGNVGAGDCIVDCAGVRGSVASGRDDSAICKSGAGTGGL
jgi:hypothetical protein